MKKRGWVKGEERGRERGLRKKNMDGRGCEGDKVGGGT